MSPQEISAQVAAASPGGALSSHGRSTPASGGHALVARELRALGVTHVYCVPGAPVYDTVGACAEQGIRVIGTRDQEASALMAVSQNYFAGRQVAVALVSAGVAASNALTGALVARDNCWPLLILAGAASREPRAGGQFMALDTTALYLPIAKWATTVATTAQIPATIARGFALATAGRPGPVLVEMSEDVLFGSSPASIEPPPTRRETREIPAPILDEATARLLAAKRPLLVIGKGTRWAEPFQYLSTLVNRLQIPFVSSPIARGYVSDDHPLCFNANSWDAQREADVVLIIGARLDWVFRFGTQIAADADIIQVDIHGPELGRHRASSLAVEADAGEFLRGVLGRLDADPARAAPSADRGWIDSLRDRRDRADAARAAARRTRDGHISPNDLASAIAASIPSDALCILDGNLVMMACERTIAATAPLTRLTPGSNGCMGTGIPFAIGAKIENPARPVVVISGDFAFGLHAFEMETAIRHNVPIVVVVANNDGNSGALRQHAMFPDHYPERVAMFQPGVGYHRIVEIFGGHGEQVTDVDEVGPALRRALACGKPACINVPLDPDAPFPRD